MIKISVIIPIYNARPYIYEALSSLKLQEFDDAEFICINDGSTDGSEEICVSFVNSDSRFRLYTIKNSGASTARNIGMKFVRGEYLAFMDADDIIAPNALEIMYYKAQRFNTDALIHGATYISSIRGIDCSDWIKEIICVKDKKIKNFKQSDIFTNPHCRPFLWMYLFKTEIIKKTGIKFIQNIKIGEDQVFLISYLNSVKKVLFIKDKLYTYRVNVIGSLVDIYSNNPLQKIENHILLIMYVQDNIPIITPKNTILFIEWGLNLVFWSLKELSYADQKKVVIKIILILNKWHYLEYYKKLSSNHKTMIDYIFQINKQIS